ncbi:hypothetical protein Pmani_017128 [Petrolisthes manimaculis]|uniref:EGF-like domain-containing protein n=1 Tax=Petrolisthes manimaculis TaxID=1843537 RepID=A0AAE1PQ51_9EUCA|nr:hypothetical protein Pmani_017128 [Petrolisthes manimaculis]
MVVVVVTASWPAGVQANDASTNSLTDTGGVVVREVLAGRQVYSYRFYKDVQIFHFMVPHHVSVSKYNFTANDTVACDPRNITIFLQAHSYPVINPDEAEFPPGLWVNRSKVYELHLRSDLQPAYLSVPNPVAGDWFMVAFITEASNRITQAGLFPSCHAWLHAEASHNQESDITTVVPEVHAHQDIQLLQKIEDSQYFRFYVPSATWEVEVNISNCVVLEGGNTSSSSSFSTSCPVDVAFRTQALPDRDSQDTVIYNCGEIDGPDCVVDLVPEEEAWHYLQISPTGSPVQLSLAVKLYSCEEAMDSSYHLLSRVDVDRLCRGERSALPLHTRHERAEELSSGQDRNEKDSPAEGERTWKEDREGIYGRSDRGRNEKGEEKERKGIEKESGGKEERVGNTIEEESSVIEAWESFIEKEKTSLAEKEGAFVKEHVVDEESAMGEERVMGKESAIDEESAMHGESTVGMESTMGVKSTTGGMENVTEATKNMTIVGIAGTVSEGTTVDTEEGVRNLTLGLLDGEEREVGAKRVVPFPSARPRQVLREKCWPRHNLVKKTFGGNFVFEYDLSPDENGSVPLLLNLTNASPTLLTFFLQPIIDIGGTLSVELALSPFMNLTVHNYTVYGCLTLGKREEPSPDGDGCNRGHSLEVNSSSPMTAAVAVLVPFPEPGPWYLTLRPYCYLTNTSEKIECSSNVTTILFSVTSASCLGGKCGRYGSCYQYISGGFIFSTCVCDAGYRGWGCTDSSNATPNWELLLGTLLLTLSNLFFLPAIILALKRRYFAEALVYAFTMFFSTFYHACDQEAYNFCMMRLSVMQFCDFYSAIFSFWVTLIAMAELPHSLYSLLHVAGALIVALGVEYDRTGLWVFVVPSVSAFLVMTSSWIWHCKQERGCYPSKRYWLTCLLPGVLLAATGLICYALLETHDNYYYIHSAWHATMALAILCLLPPSRQGKQDRSGDEEVEPLSGATTHLEEGRNYSPGS